MKISSCCLQGKDKAIAFLRAAIAAKKPGFIPRSHGGKED